MSSPDIGEPPFHYSGNSVAAHEEAIEDFANNFRLKQRNLIHGFLVTHPSNTLLRKYVDAEQGLRNQLDETARVLGLHGDLQWQHVLPREVPHLNQVFQSANRILDEDRVVTALKNLHDYNKLTHALSHLKTDLNHLPETLQNEPLFHKYARWSAQVESQLAQLPEVKEAESQISELKEPPVSFYQRALQNLYLQFKTKRGLLLEGLLTTANIDVETVDQFIEVRDRLKAQLIYIDWNLGLYTGNLSKIFQQYPEFVALFSQAHLAIEIDKVLETINNLDDVALLEEIRHNLLWFNSDGNERPLVEKWISAVDERLRELGAFTPSFDLMRVESQSYPFPDWWQRERSRIQPQTLSTDQRNFLKNRQCINLADYESHTIQKWLADSDHIAILEPVVRLRSAIPQAQCFDGADFFRLASSYENQFVVCSGPQGTFPVDTSKVFVRIPLANYSVVVPKDDISFVWNHYPQYKIYQLEDSGLTLPSTASIAYLSLMQTGMGESGSHHCKPGTDKRVYNLVPVHF